MTSILLDVRDDDTQRLGRRLATALRSRDVQAAPGLLSITLVLEPLPWAATAALEPPGFHWSAPARGLHLLAQRALPLHTDAGGGRLERLAGQLDRLTAAWTHLDPDATGCEPLLFTAFAFDADDPMEGCWSGLPNAALFLPELLLRQERSRTCLVFSARGPALGSDFCAERQIRRWLRLAAPLLRPPAPRTAPAAAGALRCRAVWPEDSEWLELGRRALAAIHSGGADKLVLYRRRRLLLEHPPTPATLLENLVRSYPDCRLFAGALGDLTLVSASPEQLLSKRGCRVTSDALAGTTSRSPDPARDARWARTLVEDPKTRHEQALVTTAVRTALAPLCHRLRSDDTPGVRRLADMQHLWSRVHGVLRAPANLFQVAARLHPTPAVGGSPGPAARDWLHHHGQTRRGWYAGAGGWVDRRGDGELAVLLRCALIQGVEAELFAGAGLVSGSDPHAELAETELKLGTMLHALARA